MVRHKSVHHATAISIRLLRFVKTFQVIRWGYCVLVQVEVDIKLLKHVTIFKNRTEGDTDAIQFVLLL